MKKVGISKSFIWTIVGTLFIMGASFAWQATWHGTDWIKTGAVIDAQKIAENFEFLYQRIPQSCPEVGDALVWNGKNWECGQLSSGVVNNYNSCADPNTVLGNGTSKFTVSDCKNAGGTAVWTDPQTGCVCKMPNTCQFLRNYATGDQAKYAGWIELVGRVCANTPLSDEGIYDSCTSPTIPWHRSESIPNTWTDSRYYCNYITGYNECQSDTCLGPTRTPIYAKCVSGLYVACI